MSKTIDELHVEFESIYFVKSEKELYKVKFDKNLPPNGRYYDDTNNQMRRDCCHYLQGAWRLYQELNK